MLPNPEIRSSLTFLICCKGYDASLPCALRLETRRGPLPKAAPPLLGLEGPWPGLGSGAGLEKGAAADRVGADLGLLHGLRLKVGFPVTVPVIVGAARGMAWRFVAFVPSATWGPESGRSSVFLRAAPSPLHLHLFSCNMEV